MQLTSNQKGGFCKSYSKTRVNSMKEKRFTCQISTQQFDRLIIEILITYAHAIHIIVLIPVLIKLIVQIVLETLIEL